MEMVSRDVVVTIKTLELRKLLQVATSVVAVLSRTNLTGAAIAPL